MYSCTLSLTSARDEGEWSTPPPEKRRYSSHRRGSAAGPVWTGAENPANTEILFPDRPAHSKSLYRPRYPGPQTYPAGDRTPVYRVTGGDTNRYTTEDYCSGIF